MLAHLCAANVASYTNGAHVLAFLGMLVYFFFFLWPGISFYWRVIMDPDGFPVDIRKVVTHGS